MTFWLLCLPVLDIDWLAGDVCITSSLHQSAPMKSKSLDLTDRGFSPPFRVNWVLWKWWCECVCQLLSVFPCWPSNDMVTCPGCTLLCAHWQLGSAPTTTRNRSKQEMTSKRKCYRHLHWRLYVRYCGFYLWSQVPSECFQVVFCFKLWPFSLQLLTVSAQTDSHPLTHWGKMTPFRLISCRAHVWLDWSVRHRTGLSSEHVLSLLLWRFVGMNALNLRQISKNRDVCVGDFSFQAPHNIHWQVLRSQRWFNPT